MFLGGNSGETLFNDTVVPSAYLADSTLQLSNSLTLSEEFSPPKQRARVSTDNDSAVDGLTVESSNSVNLSYQFQQLHMQSAAPSLTVDTVNLTPVSSTFTLSTAGNTTTVNTRTATSSPLQSTTTTTPPTPTPPTPTPTPTPNPTPTPVTFSPQQQYSAPPPTREQAAAMEREEKAAAKRKRGASTARDKKVMLERKRRKELTECFNRLKTVLPLPLHRPSKHTVLNASCDYIKQLQMEVQRLKEENTTLRSCFVPFTRKHQPQQQQQQQPERSMGNVPIPPPVSTPIQP
jgi:hypothetical protein